MTYQYLLFDLDGTLTDPKEGITNCLNYALSAFDFPTHNPSVLSQFIGPPLDQSFRQLVDTEDPKLINALVAKYRERYADIGYKENALYPQIPHVLAQLAEHSQAVLGLCTSKRADFAEKILALFGLTDYFQFLSGGDVGVSKSDQVASLLGAGTIDKRALLIGDRHFDLSAAQSQSIDGAGVLWGYGSYDELSRFKPAFLFEEPAEISRALLTSPK